MLTRNHFESLLVIFLWVVMSVPVFLEARQSAEPKVDPPGGGVNGVGAPQCIYCPQPEYSEKGSKATILATVLLDVIVTLDGQIAKPTVLKSPSDGLSEQALETVRKWKMKPALGANGKPTDCRVQVEVAFHLSSLKAISH
jgi:TonB family protein